MKRKTLIMIMALLLWIVPIAAVFNYSALSVQAKDYELTVVDDESVPLSNGAGHTLDIYMVYSGTAAAAIAVVYMFGSRRSRAKREEQEEMEASSYMGNLF